MAHADQGDDEKERKGGRISDFMETLAELNRGFKEMGLISGEKIENIYDCVQVFKNMYSNRSALQSEQMNVENELKQCQSRINHHDVEIEKMRVKYSAMESAINESIGIGDAKKTREIKALKENVETLKKDVDKLKNENDGKRRDDNDNNFVISAEKEESRDDGNQKSLKARIKAQDMEIEDLHNQIGDLEAEKKRKEAEFKKKLKKKDEDIEELTEQVENADKAKNPGDKKKLKALNERIEELEDGLGEKDKKLREVEQEKGNLEAEITGLSEQDAKKTREIKALKENVESLKRDMEKLKNENDGARRDDNAAAPRLANDVTKLKDELKLSNEICERKQKALETMKDKIEDGKAEMDGLQLEIAQKEADYQETLKKLNECTEKYTFLEKLYNDHKKHIDELEDKVQSQERELREAKRGSAKSEKQHGGYNNPRIGAQGCDRVCPNCNTRIPERQFNKHVADCMG